MRKTLLNHPSIQNLIQAGRAIIDEFEPKKFVYLNSKGAWEENPKAHLDRIVNELLYQFWRQEKEKQFSVFQEIFSPFLKEDSWDLIKKIKFARLRKQKIHSQDFTEEEIDTAIIQSYSGGGRLGEFYPFFLILEVLAWIIHYEATRLSAVSSVPEWNKEAKANQQEFLKQLQNLNHFLNSLSDGKQIEEFVSNILDELKAASPEIIEPISKMISEEDRLERTIGSLLEKTQDPNRREEIFSLIVEKIQPSMGVVHLTSSALLRPCLRLLLDEEIDISSGIQYAASVILSILRDSRSTETLLKAMSFFPWHYSKIRENLIYTLGNLKEKQTVNLIARILEEPDETGFLQNNQKAKIQPILGQKEEALLALGKIGLESIQCLSTLVKYEQHPSAKLKTYLAWTLGEIGKAQKSNLGGVSVDIVITLLKLLKTKNKDIFEEAVSAIKKIELPEFTHSLYLYNISAISILGLKPAQRGLYELSETLHYLLNTKKRVIIAINGDSGTGKTYFCQSIIGGFGDLNSEEILYLMRDRKKDQRIFNRLLGLKWLKKYIDPVYYQDYSISEEKDDPDEFLRQFLQENSNKRLIILDGCRDKCYFQKVIDLFYIKGELDVEVNFRATPSTRRLNLEEREIALESVKTHLSFLEEPALEDTHLYQEGIVILYDLDNSISSRLDSEETRELFEKSRIDNWGELIRIGDFKQEFKPVQIEPETLSWRQENFSFKTEKLLGTKPKLFSPQERKFRPELNEDLTSQPNLLQVIGMDDLKPKQIKFYAQDQIAGIGEEGSAFVLIFPDNRIFHTSLERSPGLALLGRDIFLINNRGELINVSFERNEIFKFGITNSPALAITAFPEDKIITGHKDGSIRLWDLKDKNVLILDAHRQAIVSLAMDYSGRIYSGGLDRTLKQWDIEKGIVRIIDKLNGKVASINSYPKGKILAITEKSNNEENLIPTLRILDFQDKACQMAQIPFKQAISNVNVYFDGRIVASLSPLKGKIKQRDRNLVIISPKEDTCEYKILDGHSLVTKDCLTLGPKIITCGLETSGHHTIRLWGTEFYVRTKLSKLTLQPA
jgi:hypothetical protein